jgi:hypothetical protein
LAEETDVDVRISSLDKDTIKSTTYYKDKVLIAGRKLPNE